MKRALITSLLLVLWSQPTLAAEGDLVSCYTSGNWAVCEWLLCDRSPTVTTCAEFDLHSGPSGLNGYAGLPEYAVAEIRKDDCDSTKVIGTLQGMSTSGGTAHNLSGNMQLGSSTTHVLNNPLTHRILRFNISNAGTTTCTDFEVVIRLWNRRFSR